MDKKYITLEKAAELEGLTYETLKKRVQRNNKYHVLFDESTKETGGKARIMININSLSSEAKKKYKEERNINEEALDKPWYVNTDIEWYISNYKTSYYKAVELGNIIREYLKYNESDRTQYAEEFAQERLGKGTRTLYRYVKNYMEASAWANKLEKETGANFDYLKVLSLCRKPKETGTFPSMSPEVKQIIKNIWFNKEFAQNLGTKEMLYSKLSAIADLNQWEKIPSYQTVTRYISYLMEDENMSNAYYMASRGMREYKNKAMVKTKRDTKSLKVLEIVMGDEHTFDCWVSYKQPNGKIIAIKPKLVAWIDVRSRVIMGDLICKDANSDILKQSLLKMIYSEPGGVPEYLYIDNGKDYTAETMTGRKRNERSSAGFDDEAKGFYKSIGIKDDHRALPYEPWSKAQVERFFRTVCNQFTRWFASYTGTLTGTKTTDKVSKDVQGMLKRGELFTMEEFFEKWHSWLENYMNKKHNGLVKQKEEWTTPRSLFENAERYEKPAPPKSYATMLMMKSERVRVYNTGINKWGNDYTADELCDYIGKHVSIKYDPNDMAVIYVFDEKGNPRLVTVELKLIMLSDATFAIFHFPVAESVSEYLTGTPQINAPAETTTSITP